MIRNQDTNFSRLINRLFNFLSTSLIGPWKTRSLGILSLLIGFYLASNVIVYFFEKSNNRVLIVLILVVITELLIRFRNTINKEITLPLYLVIIDNLRIGFIYSIVLEAFKLGS